MILERFIIADINYCDEEKRYIYDKKTRVILKLSNKLISELIKGNE